MLELLKDAGFAVKNNRGGLKAIFDNMDYRQEAAVQVGVAFTFRQKYKAKGLVNFRETDVHGFSSDYAPLSTETSCLTLAAIGYAPLTYPALRLGLGPAFHRLQAAPSYGETKLADKAYLKPGVVVEGGYNSAIGKRFSADLQLQYFYVGKGDLGTYTLEGTDQAGNSLSKRINFSDTRFSSLFFSLGIGYRLGKGI